MIIRLCSSRPRDGRWSILPTFALLTISLCSCQAQGSPTAVASEVDEADGEVLALDPVEATLAESDSLKIQVMSKHKNGHPVFLNQSAKLTWRSSAPEVAVVAGGFVRSRRPGQARITVVSLSGAEASANITVEPADLPKNPPGRLDDPQGMIPAFPGAEGFGAGALNSCDRSQPHVFIVDDGGDSGPGTLRAALAAAESAPDDELKVITFAVGGYIRLTSGGISFGGNCLYVAGQTAPGDGITVAGNRLEFHRDARDIVLRYFRIRVGTRGGDPEAILVRKGERYVFDHLSLSWSDGTLLRFTRTPIGRSGMMSDISVQHSLLGESLAEHPTAIAIGGNPKPDEDEDDAAWKYHARYSIHNNALVSNHHRNGQAPGQDFELINNVVHNWGLDAGQVRYAANVDWVNNYFQKGPMSRADYVPIGIRSSSIATRPFLRPSLHIAGNVSLGGGRFPDQNTRQNADNWQGSTTLVGWYHNDTGETPIAEFRRDARLSSKAPVPVTIQDPFDAYQAVLETAGASRGLDCEGRWVARRDAVDQRLVEDVRRGSGPNDTLASEVEAGGFPSLDSGAACADSNGDGVPDAWMLANGLDPRGPSVVGRIGSGGYSYLEHYLNGTTP